MRRRAVLPLLSVFAVSALPAAIPTLAFAAPSALPELPQPSASAPVKVSEAPSEVPEAVPDLPPLPPPDDAPRPLPAPSAPPAPPAGTGNEEPALPPGAATGAHVVEEPWASRTFATHGTWLLSIDDAVPLFQLGAASFATAGSTLTLGDPTYRAVATPRALSVDVAASERVTLGGSLVFNHGFHLDRGATVAALHLRVGYVVPLAPSLAFWPRVGVSAGIAPGALVDDFRLSSQLGASAAALLVWSVTDTWAFTLGPSLEIPLHASEQLRSPSSRLVEGREATLAPRLQVAVGITAKLDEPDRDRGGAATTPRPPRFILGVERAAPLLRWRLDEGLGGTTPSGGSRVGVEVGTADVRPNVSTSPRFGVDAVLGSFTAGAAASLGYQRLTGERDFVPGATAVETVAWTISPRVGYRVTPSAVYTFWPRVGVTYAHATTTAAVGEIGGHHLGVDVDAFSVWSPTPGVGFLLGPTVVVPITGASRELRRTVSNDGPIARNDHEVFSFAVSAGLVVEVP